MNISKNYINKLKQWIEIDNSIKKYNKHTNELRKKRSELETFLIDYGTNNNILDHVLKVQNNSVTYNNTIVMGSLNYSLIEECLEDILNNNELIEKIMEHIKRKRDINKKNTIILKNKLILD
tara:strand:- start:12049 stop:12414 length:366 start_codon:yes stop_codon:yes gene_type:complete